MAIWKSIHHLTITTMQWWQERPFWAHTTTQKPESTVWLNKGQRQFRTRINQYINQIISITADCLRQEILAPLQHVKYFSIKADEVTDRHANQEVLSLCLSFVNVTDTDKKPHVREAFLDFLHLQRATGKSISTAILTL